MEIKNKLQKLFDKEIYSISKKDNLYYVVFTGPEFIKPVYEVDIDGKSITEKSIPLPELEKMEVVYSRFYSN